MATSLGWQDYGFRDFNLQIHHMLGDGHCLIHSILFNMSRKYQNATLVERREMAADIRFQIAVGLASIDPKTGLSYYSSVADGFFYDNRHTPEFSLEGLQDLFCSKQFLGEETISILSHMLKINIYILDGKTHDVRLTADIPSIKRDSIVIRYYGDHYDAISLNSNRHGQITVFHHDHYFIRFLRRRMRKFKS